VRLANISFRPLRRSKSGIAALEFALLAPALLMIAFGVIVYSIYFTAVIGVRQAASEGARAAMAGLSPPERMMLAQTRAVQVLQGYGSLIGGSQPLVVAAPDGTGVFKVTVSYDMSASPIMRYGNFVPLPSANIVASVMVTNGGY
jgi:Flp pilus assembly protein TadG